MKASARDLKVHIPCGLGSLTRCPCSAVPLLLVLSFLVITTDIEISLVGSMSQVLGRGYWGPQGASGRAHCHCPCLQDPASGTKIPHPDQSAADASAAHPGPWTLPVPSGPGPPWKLASVFNPLEPALSPTHLCGSFSIHGPTLDPRRPNRTALGPAPYPTTPIETEFQPCPVCFLPVEQAMALRPARGRPKASLVLEQLEYVTQDDPTERQAHREGKPPRFAGYQTSEQRLDSFRMERRMRVHCGFVGGRGPGQGAGFDISDADLKFLSTCADLAVVSAVLDDYDEVKEPLGVTRQSQQRACFVMFVDNITRDAMERNGTLTVHPDGSLQKGLWRIVEATNLPYIDPRRNGLVPKMLAHRLIPNAQFLLWVDGKLQLRADPYMVLERFLWRGNFTIAMPCHYSRWDVFEEAEAEKRIHKYLLPAAIDTQMETYREAGMVPYTSAKLPVVSDLPNSCVIAKELTPENKLFSCLWFNEAHRFTARDQLAFAFVRDRVQQGAPGWVMNMFLDCEMRNITQSVRHKKKFAKRAGSWDGLTQKY